MSAFGAKADVARDPAESLLVTLNGHPGAVKRMRDRRL